MSQPEASVAAARAAWLIAGHGSVGSFIASRLLAGGADVSIFDPDPRKPVLEGRRVHDLRTERFDYVISCVPPAVAEDVPALIDGALQPAGVFFDWNTVAPAVKQGIAAAVRARALDVALLDSVDGSVAQPHVALSGACAEEGAQLLRQYGFRASIVGEQVGQAAGLKLLRSIFMKGLEALVLEYVSLASRFDGEPIVRQSLESTLGETFVSFMDVLVTTNRVHGERRSRELAGALEFFANGGHPSMTRAAVQVLEDAASAWAEDDAPSAGLSPTTFAQYLYRVLWCKPPST